MKFHRLIIYHAKENDISFHHVKIHYQSISVSDLVLCGWEKQKDRFVLTKPFIILNTIMSVVLQNAIK